MVFKWLTPRLAGIENDQVCVPYTVKGLEQDKANCFTLIESLEAIRLLSTSIESHFSLLMHPYSFLHVVTFSESNCRQQ
jgi:hypothetical protein